MSARFRPRTRGLGLILALVALFAMSATAQATPKFKTPAANGGKYLALGDSLAFGYQGVKLAGCWQTGCTTPDTTNNTGYVNVFASAFGTTYPGVDTINLGCPGETSSTLLNATNGTTGCVTYPFALHVNHPGQTQIAKAVQLLASNPGKIGPVTIDIGANDVLGLVRSCTTATGINLACVQSGAPATFATIQANLDNALSQIRAGGPQSNGGEIIVVGLYNPLYVAILQTQGPTAAAGTDALTNQLNSLMAATADKYKAYFVDPMPVFNPGNGSDPATEAGTICALTLMCVDQTTAPVSPVPFPTLGPDGKADADIHASNAGYAALGNLIYQTSGYQPAP